MFKKKNKILLAGAVLAAMTGMNTAYADCVDDIQANIAAGNNPSNTVVGLCGVTLNATAGTDPTQLIKLIAIVEANPAYSQSAAAALSTNDATVAGAGAASFNAIMNNPAVPAALKVQAADLAAKILVDNTAATFNGTSVGGTSNTTVASLLYNIQLTSPTAITTAVASSNNPNAAVVQTFIESDLAKVAITAAAAVKALSTSVAGSTQLLGTNALPSVSGTGLGQVLIFPYYTTRDGKKTIINVFNTSNRTVATKVRFHESHNSRDVLDFTIVLSPYDKWAGTVKEGTNGPILVSSDNTCSAPAIPATGVPLDPSAYNDSVSGDTDTDKTIDRLREGYIEVIAMGDATEAVIDAAKIGLSGNAGAPTGKGSSVSFLLPAQTPNVAYNAKHVKNGTTTTPRNCGAVVAAFDSNPSTVLGAGSSGSPKAANQFYALQPGSNPLRGALTIVDEEKGVGFGINAMAIADFNNSVNLISAQTPPYFHEPTIASRNGLWTTTGLAAFEAAISYNTVINEWANNPHNGANTDWIIQFPTKAFHVDIPYADKTALTGCKDDNLQAARNKFRGNLDCTVTSDGGATGAVAVATAAVASKTTDLAIAQATLTALTSASTTAAAAAAAATTAKTAADLAVTTTADTATTDALAAAAAAASAATTAATAAIDAAAALAAPTDAVLANTAQASAAAAALANTDKTTTAATAQTSFSLSQAAITAADAATTLVTTTAAAATNAAALIADAADAVANVSTAQSALDAANLVLTAAKATAASASTTMYSGNLGNFEKRFGPGGSLVSLSTLIIDKEENTADANSGVVFSPARASSMPTLPWESNVITFAGTGGTSVMSSNSPELALTISPQLTETNGMAIISFAKAGGLAAAGKGTLPVIGFVAKQRNQGDSTRNFGQIMGHSYK